MKVSRFSFFGGNVVNVSSPLSAPRFPLLAFRSSLSALLLLLATIFAVSTGQAQDSISPTEAMLAANQNYEAGNYAEAAAGYEAIIAFGIQNSDVYYNLGNVYFKLGDVGRAILNYRRAYRLDPRDPDITANLAIARAQTIDRLEAPGGALANLVQLAEDWLTLDEAAILAVILWLLCCGLAGGSILWPRFRRWTWLALAIVGLPLAMGLTSIANRYYTEQWYPAVVVVAPQVNVTSGPGHADQYLVEFELHSGAELRLLESRSGWRRISLPGDLQG
ncbi:MAG: tetratricopeptide repeat protein, partial [Chloroflexota bacterium]